MQLNLYQSFEVKPCLFDGSSTGCELGVQQCEPQEADFWTLYGRQHPDKHGIAVQDAILDLYTEHDAKVALQHYTLMLKLFKALAWCEQVYGTDWPRHASIRDTIREARGGAE